MSFRIPRNVLAVLVLLPVWAAGCSKPDTCVQKCVSDSACIEQLRSEKLLEKDAPTDEAKCDLVCKGHRMNLRGTAKTATDPCMGP